MINVCLVGNPNTGKTTLFNTLTGANEHTGNWHGVTVEERAKVYSHKGKEIKLVDLPGIYSLSPLSFEEKVSRDWLYNHQNDLVINICDASNLRRNLYLTLCLLELGLNVVVVVNQIDKKPICKCDYQKLSNLLGVNIVHLNAGDLKDCQNLNDIIANYVFSSKYSLPYLKDINFSRVEEYVKYEENQLYYKIKLLEDDEFIKKKLNVEKTFDLCEDIASARYCFIDNLLKKTCTKNERVYGKSRIDNFLLNRILALPFFLLLLAGIFYLTFFSLGKWVSDGFAFLVDSVLFSPLAKGIALLFGEGSWIEAFFNDAICAGVGSVISFLPQVVLLFLFLSMLEDSGYLSRIAFLFDDILSKVGLSGKAIYTLLMGFGCSTSAVLTARNMEDKNSKIKTALLTPYMSCSAKFPIYSVLGGAFFGAFNIWVILGLYLLGVVVAILISLIFEKTCLKSKKQSFILEFPPYRIMNLKRTGKVLWQNVKLFLTRVGGIIIAMNVVVWCLANFTITLAYVPQGTGVSILETLGRMISPIFTPLGFGSWALVASLIAGLVAKEVIVSSIAMFNGVSGISDQSFSILSLSALAGFASASSVLSYLVFCLLYVPCFATISVLNKEIGKKWTWISILIEFVVAYICAFVVYSVASACEIFGFARVAVLILACFSIVLSVVLIIKKVRKKRCPYGKKCLKECNKK